ncbi:MAG: excinuclease ABC subunit UvrC [Vicinamibacterales bacterium]
MPIQELKAQIARLPAQPGVYLFSNAEGETVYVGKARSLRDRVRSYLAAAGADPKTDALLSEADGLEFILTDSVVEALALENHLIKQRMPRYNILLRDDKNYPYLRLTTSEAFPRVLVARRVERDGDYYAGPFLPAHFARKTMGLTHRLFGIRSCNEEITGRRGRPCLEFDIGRCVAPCVASLCSRERYAQAVSDTKLFLEGRNDELVQALRGRMNEAAAGERYEEAAHLRDAMRTVEALRDRQQKMSTPRLGDRDAFGLKVGPAGGVIHVFQVRSGRVVERVELSAEGGVGVEAEREVLQAALQQFYEAREVPPVVHVPLEIEEPSAVEQWLSSRTGRRVKLVVPRRGDSRGLLDLAARNAAAGYDLRFNQAALAEYDALEKLRATLGLPAVPRRIECFDVSTIQGSETVASLVVCEDGRMRRSEYRKFRIRGSGGETGRIADDFAAMREVILRRFRRLLESGGDFPDLVVVDGGRGHLSSAYQALSAIGLARLAVVGLAKKEERIYTRDDPDPIALDGRDPALRLLQRIRDEAHRFAVAYHRTARRRRDLKSEMDGVAGIGPRRRRKLLERFGSVAGVRRASREELVAAIGARAADSVLRYFAGSTRSGF